jgi:ArsR family transcriptional regulator
MRPVQQPRHSSPISPANPGELGASFKTTAIADLESKVALVANELNLLANAGRIRILCRLAASPDELSFGQLAGDSAMSQSALSQHLSKLQAARIVTVRRSGHHSFFELPDGRVKNLIAALPQLLR